MPSDPLTVSSLCPLSLHTLLTRLPEQTHSLRSFVSRWTFLKGHLKDGLVQEVVLMTTGRCHLLCLFCVLLTLGLFCLTSLPLNTWQRVTLTLLHACNPSRCLQWPVTGTGFRCTGERQSGSGGDNRYCPHQGDKSPSLGRLVISEDQSARS